MQAAQQNKTLGIICTIAIIAILAATLWPFKPFPPNEVHWLTGANGIVFDSAGLVLSETPLRVTEKLNEQSCSLELLLRPASVESLYTILSFYTPRNPGQFLLRQWRDGLLVSHDVLDDRNRVKRRKIDVDHAFEAGGMLLVTIVSGSNGTTVYENGRQAQLFRQFTISRSELSGQIVLGASSVDYQPWLGEIRGLAIYSNELTPEQVLKHYRVWTVDQEVDLSEFNMAIAVYRFTERSGRTIQNAVVSQPDLEIPRNFTVPHKAVLKNPLKEFQASWGYVKDILLNVGGFVPLGFVFCAYFLSSRSRKKAILLTIFTAGLLSFAIEVLQMYIPRRVSGMTDIITNTLGAVLGAALARPRAVQRFLRILDGAQISE